MDYETFIRESNHPIIGQPNHVKTNGLMAEVEAAKAWGIVPDPDGELPEAWFMLPRKARALMTSQVQLNSLTTALIGFDAKKYWEDYWASVKPPRGGRR